jgi:hypothetical protein
VSTGLPQSAPTAVIIGSAQDSFHRVSSFRPEARTLYGLFHHYARHCDHGLQAAMLF